jgi:hypothetical protein
MASVFSKFWSKLNPLYTLTSPTIPEIIQTSGKKYLQRQTEENVHEEAVGNCMVMYRNIFQKNDF